MNIQTATEFTIPGLEGINAYRVGNTGYVSKSQLCMATRGHKDTSPLNTWLNSAAANPSDSNGSESFPQGFSAAALEAVVPHESGSKVAHLIRPFTAYHWFMHEAGSTKAHIRDRAMKLIISVGAVGMDTLVKEACGLSYSPQESFSDWMKLQPTHEKAGPINEVKELLVSYGYRDRSKRMGEIVNEIFYNRLPVDVFERLKEFKREYYAKHNSWCGPSLFQCLNKEVQDKFNAYASAALVLLHDDHEVLNMTKIVQKLDRIAPRFRKSYIAFAN